MCLSFTMACTLTALSPSMVRLRINPSFSILALFPIHCSGQVGCQLCCYFADSSWCSSHILQNNLDSEHAYPRPVSKLHQQLPPRFIHPAQAFTASWPLGWGAWPDVCERFAPTVLECWKPPGSLQSDQNRGNWRGQQHKAEDFQQGYPSPSAGWTSCWRSHRLDTAVSPGVVCQM